MDDLKQIIDEAFPPCGPCAMCGGGDARHRIFDAIFDRACSGETYADLAADYGVIEPAIEAVVRSIVSASALELAREVAESRAAFEAKVFDRWPDMRGVVESLRLHLGSGTTMPPVDGCMGGFEWLVTRTASVLITIDEDLSCDMLISCFEHGPDVYHDRDDAEFPATIAGADAAAVWSAALGGEVNRPRREVIGA